jgi:hypothetical protein
LGDALPKQYIRGNCEQACASGAKQHEILIRE